MLGESLCVKKKRKLVCDEVVADVDASDEETSQAKKRKSGEGAGPQKALPSQ